MQILRAIDMSYLTTLPLFLSIQALCVLPALAAESICAENVNISSISTGSVDNNSRSWSVSYLDGESILKTINSDRWLNTDEGLAMLKLIENAKRHGDTVTFKHFSGCAINGANWFDHITIN